jgi:phosphoglycolate phosphatase-like HAD superfamily hydrolase
LIKGIIYDFDGVIAQSVKVKTDAFATIYSKYGDKIVNKVINHHEANGGVSRFDKIKFYHESFLKKDVTDEEIKIIANKFSKLVIKKVINAPYVEGVLNHIKDSYKKYKLFISTGTPKDEIDKILIARRINNYFTQVFGSPENKICHIKELILNNNVDSNELLFFGDSDSDIIAANYFNIKFILITHTYNKNLLKKYSGYYYDSFTGIDNNIFNDS